MDLWSVSVKSSNTHTSTRCPNMALPCRSLDAQKKLGMVESVRVLPIRVRKGGCYYARVSHPSLVVTAMAKENRDNSSQSSSSSGDDEKNNSSDGNKTNEADITSDWREFRASLFAQEQAEKVDNNEKNGSHKSKPLALKWAHPIAVPETGCVLVATEKLDGVHTFERTVVLLLRSGTRHPQEGPFGVVINRPLHKKIKHMKPTNLDLATTFADCTLQFGGPLEASMFLLKSGDKPLIQSFEEVMPGLYFGARNSLEDAAGLVRRGSVKPEDFRFFMGYAGWQLDQLRQEIESEYWYVASCSPNLIYGGSPDSSEKLWEEILQLMGGEYSDLSRKPKQDM
uniref:Uncharacterized protein n=1 Tax=Kalanchoe fedtschenkoi TaxID=63787 RepID=A0A7N0UA22_KALFE